MVDPSQVWILEYSKQQRAFQADTLDVILKRNLDAFARNLDASRDFVPIAIADSHAEAIECRVRLEEMLRTA